MRLLGRISRAEGDRNFVEENQDLTNGDGEAYQVVGKFIQPCVLHDMCVSILDMLAVDWIFTAERFRIENMQLLKRLVHI